MKVFGRRFGSRLPPATPEVPPASAWPFATLATAVIAVKAAEDALRRQAWDEVDRHLHDVEADPPDRARYLTMRALVSNGRQDWPQLERRWQAVIDAFPNCGDAYTGRATAIRMQDRMLDCVDAYRMALEKAPLDLAPPSMLAHMLEHLPAALVAELVPMLDKALDRHLDDKRQQPLVHWSKGKVALADGDLVRAVQSLRIARTAAINDPAIRAELDMAEARLAAVELAGAQAPFRPASAPGDRLD